MPDASERPHAAQRDQDARAPCGRGVGRHGYAGFGRMNADPRAFREAGQAALHDEGLRIALGRLKTHFALGRALAVERYGDWEGLREQGRAIRDYALANLDTLL